MAKYKYLEDAGHAWLEVPIADIVALGIEDRISQYSYQKGKYAYLEEDSDAPIFIQAYAETLGYPPTYSTEYVGDYADIRYYRRFKGETL